MYLLSFEFFIILEIVTRVGDLDLKIPAHFLTEDDLLETVHPLKMANICLKLNAKLGASTIGLFKKCLLLFHCCLTLMRC